MKTFLLWLFIFLFGFMIGAGVGFKVLEGVSTELVIEAANNSSAQFKQAYSGSLAQQKVEEILAQQKAAISEQLRANVKSYLGSLFGK